MDGDDYFSKNKLYFLDKLINKKKIFFNQDNPMLVEKNFTISKKIKKTVKKYYMHLPSFFLNNPFLTPQFGNVV